MRASNDLLFSRAGELLHFAAGLALKHAPLDRSLGFNWLAMCLPASSILDGDYELVFPFRLAQSQCSPPDLWPRKASYFGV
jgi:hypothetical protein